MMQKLEFVVDKDYAQNRRKDDNAYVIFEKTKYQMFKSNYSMNTCN